MQDVGNLIDLIFVVSPNEKKGSVFGGFFVIAIMSLMACCKKSSVFGEANAFGVYWSVSVILTMLVAGM